MDFLAPAAKFLGLSGLTTVAALALASRWDAESRSERLLGATTLFAGIALVTSFVLGLAGKLTYWHLFGAQAAIALAGSIGARWSAVWALIDPRGLWQALEGGPQRVAAVLVTFAYAYVVAFGLISEPFGGDALMYHLPILVEYARSGQIVIPELGRYWNNDIWAYYPGNAYLLYQWWVLPIGRAFFADLSQLPFAWATALATYVLARRLGATRGGAVWGGLLFLAVPLVINQSKTVLVDITLTYFIVSGLTFLLAPALTPMRLLLVAIAWGASPGVKLSATPYLALGMVCAAAFAATETPRAALLRRVLAMAAATAGGIALLSGYWFGRNYLLTGSPLYPLNLLPPDELAWSNILFYGPILPLLDLSIYASLFFYNYETGAGVQYAALALPGCVALLLWALRRRRFGVAAVALLPLVAYPLWLFRSSRSVHTLFRYVLPSLPVAFAASGWMMSRSRRATLLGALALVSIAFSVVNALPHVGSFVYPASIRSILLRLRRNANGLGRFDQMGDLALQDYRRAWDFLDQLDGPHTIAVSHLIFAYPMLGPDFRHRLRFLPASGREQWLAAVRSEKIDHVALAEMTDTAGELLAYDNLLEFNFKVGVTSDEYVAAFRPVGASDATGIRVTYEVDPADNARVLIGRNSFYDVAELPLEVPRTKGVHTIEWTGEVRTIEIALGFVPRTRLREEIRMSIHKIEVLRADGTSETVPITRTTANQWQHIDWPLEYYWMATDPERFQLAFKDRDYWSSPYSGEMQIYRVVDKEAR